MNTTDREVWYLEFKLNRYFFEVVSRLILYRRESEMSSHKEFFAARELLYDPHHAALVRYVLDGADVGLEHRRVNVDGHGYYYLYIVGNGLLFELRPRLDDEFNF